LTVDILFDIRGLRSSTLPVIIVSRCLFMYVILQSANLAMIRQANQRLLRTYPTAIECLLATICEDIPVSLDEQTLKASALSILDVIVD